MKFNFLMRSIGWGRGRLKPCRWKVPNALKALQQSPFSGLGFSAAGHFNVWRRQPDPFYLRIILFNVIISSLLCLYPFKWA